MNPNIFLEQQWVVSHRQRLGFIHDNSVMGYVIWPHKMRVF